MAPRVKLGTSPNTLLQRRGMPLQHHEEQQLAYLVAATLTGDPVSSPGRLTSAGQTLHDVRVLLKHGRGNVDADAEPSRGHNLVGASIAYNGLGLEQKIALAGALGAGFCDQFARLAALSHAPHLREGEWAVTVGAAKIELQELNEDETVSVRRTGHAWNELRLDHGSRNGDSTIAQDGWSNGPAVRLKDSVLANVQVDKEDLKLDKDEALWLKDRVEGLMPLVHPAHDEFVASRVAAGRRRHADPDRFLEVQVVSPAFAARARDALQVLTWHQQAELTALMAQQAYGLSAEQANDPDFIRSVLAQVARLDEQDRPPVVAPDY